MSGLTYICSGKFGTDEQITFRENSSYIRGIIATILQTQSDGRNISNGDLLHYFNKFQKIWVSSLREEDI